MSLWALREKWFSNYEFPAGTQISVIKYRHPGLKHSSSFYYFKNQLDYALVYYFAELEITKGNINKFLTDPLMTAFTEKLSYTNTNEWIKKLLEISWGILRDKRIEHKFNIESDVFGIAKQKIAIQL